MLKRYAKLSAGAVLLILMSLSSNSFAGDIFGKVGYGHHPFHIVVGYSDHGKHYKRKHYKHKHYHHKKHYYHAKHYRHHARYHGYRGHYYNPPRRYCRSRY